jgi:hypothetical protein
MPYLSQVFKPFTRAALTVAAWMAVLLVVDWLAVRPVLAVDAVVVRPAAWASAIDDWKAYREQQGYEIAEIDAEIGRQAIRAAIAQLAGLNPDKLRFVLLAGDVSPRSDLSVPTFYHSSTAMSQFGGDPTIASDNDYGDIDGDSVPELAVGRVPADSAAQLKSALERVIAYERQQDFSHWRRDVHVVAGVGGFGAVADSVIEMTTRRFLADRIPGWSELSMTQASLKSHYCPDPWRFSEACVGRMNQGGMFWVYIGHGHVKTLDYVRAEEQWLPIFTHEHLGSVDVGSRPPIAIFLACYTGAFDAQEDSLAEQLVMRPTGPIAALAASRVSGPYGLAMLSDGLLSHCFESQVGTLGEVVLCAKQQLLQKNHDPDAATAAATGQLQMISAIAGALSPEGYDLEAERREHVWEMNLLGDPMLHICHPGTLELQVPSRAQPGESIAVVGRSETAGQLTLELAYRRDQVRRDLNGLSGDLATQVGREQYQQRYVSANQRVLVSQVVPIVAGEFTAQLSVPVDLQRGKYAVRAFLEGQTCWSVGYQEITIRASE